MRKRMKKKFVAICISLAITLTGPGMSMVTMTYADEITKENQQDQEISNDQNNTKDGENSNTNDGKETENDLIQGNDSDSSQEKAEENITEEESKEDNMEAQQEEPSEETDSEEAVTQRKVLNINDGWNFSTNDTSTAGWNFPSGAGNGVVNLPHSWEYVHPRQSYIPQMNSKTVTYEKTVNISEIKNKNLFIKFYGAARNTEVFIDGEKVGTHVGGYSAFVFDITNYVQGKDEITIKANVTNIDTVSIPINVDYTQWGGIYRDVELISTDDQYISLEDYGNKGIYIDSNVNGTTADVNVKNEISNKSNDDKELKIVTDIYDADGNKVTGTEQKVTAKANKNVQPYSTKCQIDNVHLWNGTKDPYLYTANVTVYNENDEVLDTVSDNFGVRTYEIKNGKFYLNGQEYEIHGVGMHQDREGYGNAVPDDLKVQDMNLMQEMGVNAIRTSHYPHSQSTYNLADERGMLVYCEIPYYLLLSNAESYKTSIKEELKEMIRQGYNHPSIMMWGIENEVYQPASAAAFGKDFQINENTLVSFNSSVAKLAQKEDTTRYIVQAQIDSSNANKVCAKWSKNGNVDYTGVNLYVGFKSSVSSADDEGRKEITDTLNRKLNEYKQTYNASSMMITEYGAGANINQHATMDENFSWSSDDASKDKHYEEYQAFVLETYYSLIQKRKDIPVSFVWNMFDFSCYRNEGGIPRRNTKGLVCYDHTTKKDAFYFYKANWNQQDKFVYLTSKRYTERDTKYQQIKVYSNCEGVELFVNGQSVGKGRKQQSGVFVWDDVKLDDMNTIKAVGTSDGQTYSDEVSGIKAENKNSATSIKYQTHIQSIGWQEAKKDGQTSGTIGKGLRMEALKVKLQNKKYGGNIEYRTHIAQKGWQDWKKNGQTAGTTGEKLAMEAVRLKLTGELAEHYDIYYRVHSQSYGWLGWAKNGEIAGTAGLAKRMEAIQIKLVEKGGKAPGTSEKHYVSNQGVFYQSHVQTYGWQTWKQNGETSGTSGQAKRLEAIKIKLQKMKVSGNIEYQSHVQTYGWEKSWKKNGQLSGTSGKAKRLEAVKIRLTGEMKNKYDVYYRVHAQSYGWLGWAKNGEKAGTEGLAKRLEAVQIVLVEKGGAAPGSTEKTFIKK